MLANEGIYVTTDTTHMKYKDRISIRLHLPLLSMPTSSIRERTTRGEGPLLVQSQSEIQSTVDIIHSVFFLEVCIIKCGKSVFVVLVYGPSQAVPEPALDSGVNGPRPLQNSASAQMPAQMEDTGAP